MSYKVDFHVHSHYSDGTLSPTDLVKWAQGQKLDIIAITDHDGIDGVKEGQIAGNALDLSVVAGIEFSAETGQGEEVHILGYYIDIDNEELLEACKKIKEMRNIRNAKYIDILEKEYGITKEDLIFRKGQNYIGKPTIARALKNKGIINNSDDAFMEDGFFRREDVSSIKKEKIGAKEAIDLIKGAGGIAVLAHPGLIKNIGKRESEEFYNNFDSIIKNLKMSGLKGLECVYSKHSDEERIKFIEYAEKYHLHITEGSDYHGPE